MGTLAEWRWLAQHAPMGTLPLQSDRQGIPQGCLPDDEGCRALLRDNNYYSVLNATTGSFLAADLAGTTPAIEVNTTLNKTIIKAVSGVKWAIDCTRP